jgi:hypothetical protein
MPHDRFAAGHVSCVALRFGRLPSESTTPEPTGLTGPILPVKSPAAWPYTPTAQQLITPNISGETIRPRQNTVAGRRRTPVATTSISATQRNIKISSYGIYR